MAAVSERARSDAWTDEDDAKLNAIVLRHIRNGSTRLAAFGDAAWTLHRTAAACGFRWNGRNRSRCADEVNEAERERLAVTGKPKGQKGKRVPTLLWDGKDEFTLERLIRALHDFERRYRGLLDETKQGGGEA